MASDHFSQVVDKIWLVPLVREIVNPIILLLVAGAFVMFLWGVFNFIRNAGDATQREQGRNSIVWGIAGLVVMFGAYGIINIALTTFNLPTIHKISTVATNQIGGSSGSACTDAGATTGTGGTATDISTMVAGSAKVAANTGANSCAALAATGGDTYREISLNQCSCTTTQGVVCCGEFPASQPDVITIDPTLTPDTRISDLITLTLPNGTTQTYNPQPSCSGDAVLAAKTFADGITAIKQLMTTCPHEVGAKFITQTTVPEHWFDYQEFGATGGYMSTSVIVASEKAQSENNANYNAPDGLLYPGIGLLHLVHTHPTAMAIPYLPPSGTDIESCLATDSAAKSISMDYEGTFEYDVVAPNGLYSFNCDGTNKYVEPFTPSAQPWTTDDENKFLSTEKNIASQIDQDFPVDEILKFQDIYAGPIDTAGNLAPSSATLAQKQSAVDGLLGLYSSIGISVTLTPWGSSIPEF